MNVRFAGMLIAVAVAYAIALLPLDLGQLGLLGAPVVGLLAWWLTPTTAGGSWRWAMASGLGMGALAAPLGAVAIAYLGLLGALSGVSEGSEASDAILVVIFGLPFSAFVLPITLPAGLIWSFAVRAGLGRAAAGGTIEASSLGVVHVAIFLAVVAVGAALLPLGRT